MNWADFLFGIWVGACLLAALELAALGTWAVLEGIWSRLKKLEDANQRGRE